MVTGLRSTMVKKKNQTTNNIGLKKIEDTHLSIQLSLDGFSFCIVDLIRKEIGNVTHYKFTAPSDTPQNHLKNVEEVFKIEPLLQKSYSSVNVSHVNALSSVVPKALFNENLLPDYLKFSHKIFKNDFITYDEIENHDIVNVYIPFVNINNYLIDRFGSFDYMHFSTVFIKNLLDTYKFSERPHLFVMVDNGHFEILAIANNQMLLYNSFEYTTKEDFIYYVLFTAEQLHFNPNSMELVFLGKTVKDDEIYDMAYTYVKNVSFLENRNPHQLIHHLTDEEQRKFFTLLHQY